MYIYITEVWYAGYQPTKETHKRDLFPHGIDLCTHEKRPRSTNFCHVYDRSVVRGRRTVLHPMDEVRTEAIHVYIYIHISLM